jgi:hypothetical protein
LLSANQRAYSIPEIKAKIIAKNAIPCGNYVCDFRNSFTDAAGG